MIKICTIDFETEEILPRPHYPPKPVGLAITWPNGKSEYMSWGHPTQNNCTKAEARRKLREIYSQYRVLCHGGKFDLEVGEEHFNLPLVPKHGWDDSLLLAFLHDPREPSLKLKILAPKHLNVKTTAQDKLHQWILDNVPGGKQAKTKWGKYICLAPGKLVGIYAKDDTKMTKGLYKKFIKYITDNGMLEQYDIEKRTAIKVIKMEREGVPIDYKMLAPDLIKAKKVMTRHENVMRKIVGDINFNSAPQKIEAFERLGLVDEWEYGEETKTGQINPKTGIESLMRVCTDKKLVHHLDMFSKYSKIIGTYMQPWLNSALENDGLFYPWFNTIKGDNDKGTYTGRFSSNFQQVPREPKKDYKTLPFLRNYIVADKKSHTLFNRDFSSQEIRILAHFEDGELLEAYLANPTMDVHNFVKDIMMNLTGNEYDRSDHVKPCNFLVVYGGGAKALAKNIEVPYSEAQSILTAHGNALPGVKDLKQELKLLNRQGKEFKTAGGRWYDFEENFEYVALNTLIQGSAADHTKRALLNIDDMLEAQGHDARIMLTVHDEFMLSGAKRNKKKIMSDFKEAMEYDELFDLPMLSDGKMGERWGKMKKMKKGQ